MNEAEAKRIRDTLTNLRGSVNRALQEIDRVLAESSKENSAQFCAELPKRLDKELTSPLR